MNSKEKMTPDEKWDNATLANNFIFYKVMRNHPEAYKHFFIAPLCARMVEDKEVKDFFEFLISNRAADDYTNSLQDYVKAAKKNAQWKEQYMTYERIQAYAYDNGKEAGIAEGITQGVLQGTRQKAVEAATELLKEGDSPEKIARCIGLPLEQVLELQKQITININQ